MMWRRTATPNTHNGQMYGKADNPGAFTPGLGLYMQGSGAVWALHPTVSNGRITLSSGVVLPLNTWVLVTQSFDLVADTITIRFHQVDPTTHVISKIADVSTTAHGHAAISNGRWLGPGFNPYYGSDYCTDGDFSNITVQDTATTAAQDAALLTIYRDGLFSVSGVTPPTGVVGTTVTVNGSNFYSGATVTFGGVAAATTFISSSVLSVVAPSHAIGAVDVIVTNPDAQTSTLTNGFTYVSSGPTLISVPTTATVGQYITAVGTNFDLTATLSIGGINLVTGLQDSTHINAVVPEIVGGPWDVTVRNSFKNPATLTKAITTKKRGS
jgi:hypothetical protein